ncbi:MAG: pantetheine-phosphate adenylyltransferase [Gammaproteobacteria bacterium]
MNIGAMYPGTFDPFTNGHEEIVRRAAKIYSRVVVAIAASNRKAPLFTLDERISLAQQVLAQFDNVEVVGYEGLTVQVARERDLQVVIRGLRAVADYEYELQLANMNRHLEPGIETVFLTPTERTTFISSTLVREVAAMGGDVTAFVRPQIKQALDAKNC